MCDTGLFKLILQNGVDYAKLLNQILRSDSFQAGFRRFRLDTGHYTLQTACVRRMGTSISTSRQWTRSCLPDASHCTLQFGSYLELWLEMKAPLSPLCSPAIEERRTPGWRNRLRYSSYSDSDPKAFTPTLVGYTLMAAVRGRRAKTSGQTPSPRSCNLHEARDATRPLKRQCGLWINVKGVQGEQVSVDQYREGAVHSPHVQRRKRRY
jgi:hypothetical protein